MVWNLAITVHYLVAPMEAKTAAAAAASVGVVMQW